MSSQTILKDLVFGDFVFWRDAIEKNSLPKLQGFLKGIREGKCAVVIDIVVKIVPNVKIGILGP